MRDDWSQEEVEEIVTDYTAMFERDLLGLDYNKAEHNRHLQRILPNRSRSSIEKKHQNISAVLWHLGYPYIEGYKPLPKYQTLLRQVVEARLAGNNHLNQIVSEQVRLPVESIAAIENPKVSRVPPPNRKKVKSLIKDESRVRTGFARRNYLEIEARNQSLGRAGEEIIFRFEQERQRQAGKFSLAGRVELLSRTQGD